MAPNGSINNTLYVNPFDPAKGSSRLGGGMNSIIGGGGGVDSYHPPRRKDSSVNATISGGGSAVGGGGRNNGYNSRRSSSSNNNNNGSINGNNGYAMSPSPKGSPQRRVRIAARSRSSDLSDFDLMERETGIEDIQPKHLRSRLSQVSINIISFIIMFSVKISKVGMFIRK